MTTIQMANIVLRHSGRAMNASEFLAAVRAVFAMRPWDVVDEVLAGRTQVQAFSESLGRDDGATWFTRDHDGRYIADDSKLADALFGQDVSN